MRDIKESILSQVGGGDSYFRPMIESWLNNHKSVFRDFTLRDDLKIDVKTDVNYTEDFPNYITFGEVKGFTLNGWKGDNKDLGKVLPESCTSLSIYDCPNIKDFSSVKVEIKYNGIVSLGKLKNLTSVEGIENLFSSVTNDTKVLQIVDCGKLKDLSEGNVSDIGVIYIKNCNKFKSLQGVEGARDVTVIDCKSFSSLEGINTDIINSVDIVGCSNLNSIDPLKKGPLKNLIVLKIKNCGPDITMDSVKNGLITKNERVKIIV